MTAQLKVAVAARERDSLASEAREKRSDVLAYATAVSTMPDALSAEQHRLAEDLLIALLTPVATDPEGTS